MKYFLFPAFFCVLSLFGYDNIELGIPGKADCIVDREGYALGYIEYHEQPAWVIYKLTSDEVTTKVAKRSNKFKADPEIPTGMLLQQIILAPVMTVGIWLQQRTCAFPSIQWQTAFT